MLACVALLIQACSDDPAVDFDGPVIARVGDTGLTLEEARLNIPDHLLMADSAAAIERYREQWIRKQVMINEARRNGIEESTEYQYRLQKAKDEIMLQLFVDQLTDAADDIMITEDEAMRYYDRHRSKFVLSERHLRFHHMITENQQQANTARQQLLNGADWEDLADQYAVDPDYAISNSSRLHPAGTALENYPAIAHFVTRIGVTEISPIRLIDGQYHFVQLLDDFDAGEIPDLDWALYQIEQWLRIEKKKGQIQAYQQNLIRQAEANREIRRYD